MIFGSQKKLKCEYSAEMIASLFHVMITSGDKVGYLLLKDKITQPHLPKQGKNHFDLFLHEISNAENYGGASDLLVGIDYFLENFRDKSLVMLIIGKRGGGKTALGMKFVEIGKILDKKSYVIGFENSKTPKWVRKVNNLEDVPNNSLVLVDEAGISFSARESMKKANKEMANLLSIARHKNLSLIFITQNCMSLRTKVITEKSIKTLKDLNNKDNIFAPIF